jgi:ribonuclease BN (tRNA processing enzyme)
VDVRFVGTGDAFGSGGRWQTCIRVTSGDQALLVDCGATSLAALRAQGIDPQAVDVVAVTHLHGDHFGGLPFLILDGQFTRRTAPLRIVGPPGTGVRLAATMEALFPGSTQVTRRFASLRAYAAGIEAAQIVLTHMSADMLGRLDEAEFPAVHDGLSFNV